MNINKKIKHDKQKKGRYKMKRERNKGITLIALVITIIVLLILAGVSIATLGGDNGILAKAKLAKNNTQQAQVKEEIELAIQEILTERYDKEKLTNEKIAEYLPEKLENVIITEVSEDKIKGEYKGYEFEINNGYHVTIIGTTGGIVTYELDPKGYTRKRCHNNNKCRI